MTVTVIDTLTGLRDRIREAVAEVLERDLQEVGDETDLKRDLGADSLDLLNLVTLLERILGIPIADDEADRFSTVAAIEARLRPHLA
jgi:acyl carrier protein